MPATSHGLLRAQSQRLAQYQVAQSVDIHCHCLPGLDDGPATMDDALALCRALADDGITAVIATPHQLGRFDEGVSADAIRRGVSGLNAALDANAIPLAVVPGADIRVDERIPALLDAGRILTLADDGRYVLLEMPHTTFFDIRRLLVGLVGRGVTPIVSHPERNVFLARRPDGVLPWLETGALLQITAASVLGDFGPEVECAAWHWLGTGAASLVASDAHDPDGRRPRVSDAIDRIVQRLGHPAAYRTCMLNPVRVLTGKRIVPWAR